MSRIVAACALIVVLAGFVSAQAPAPEQKERVDGIGGYSDHLGVTLTPADDKSESWQQLAGPTVFQPFPANTTYFGSADHSFMLNFRVKNLDAMVAQLRRAGITVDVDPKTYPNGRFARLSDPEGNPIQLWQPQRNAS
jgi:predicted enzyme related to lactoylglutathione lyase